MFLALGTLIFTGCGDDDTPTDPCDGVTCETGEACVNGSCVSLDPCEGVTCATGEECVNGNCVDAVAVVVKSGFVSAETWTSDNIYELAGKVIVRSGEKLTIEPGTIIKGRTGTGSLASALVVERGAVIMAMGTAEAPIIMTTALDDIRPGQMVGSNSEEDIAGQWGGLIILGRAPISAKGSQEAQIEGIPADESYGLYGGNNDADNSGTITYLSVRHGGALIGDGNEINGITLGGVGSGTTINNIEVVANLDDGIEFFGGSVSVTNAIVVAQQDDALDIDQAYSGTIDNALVIHSADSDSALEIDGPEGSDNADGKFTITNSTFVGAPGTAGKDRGATLKSKAQGVIENSLWEGEFNTFLRIRESFDQEDNCADKTDAYDYLTGTNDLIVRNNDIITTLGISDVVSVFLDEDDDLPTCEAKLTDTQQSAAQGVIANSGNSLVGNSSKGADKSAFTGWSWADNKGKL